MTHAPLKRPQFFLNCLESRVHSVPAECWFCADWLGCLKSSFCALFPHCFIYDAKLEADIKRQMLDGGKPGVSRRLGHSWLREHGKQLSDIKVTHMDWGGWEVIWCSRRPQRRNGELSQFRRVTGFGILCNLEERLMTNLFQTSGTEVFEWLLSLTRVRQTKLSSPDARWPHSKATVHTWTGLKGDFLENPQIATKTCFFF